MKAVVAGALLVVFVTVLGRAGSLEAGGGSFDVLPNPLWFLIYPAYALLLVGGIFTLLGAATDPATVASRLGLLAGACVVVLFAVGIVWPDTSNVVRPWPWAIFG